jgi:O-antigen/teichoic acid export membrane protein
MSAAVEYDAVVPESSPASGGSPRASASIFKKGFWAIADQGLFAGSNFVINIMLARWLSKAEYGAFSKAFAAFLGLAVIHTALLTEPMLVLGPARYRPKLKKYIGSLFYGNVVVSVAISGILLLAGLYELGKNQTLGHALLWFSLFGPFTLFQWMIRRACYVEFNPKRAAFGGMGYLVMMMSSMAVVHHFNKLSIATALATIGISSLISGLWLMLGYTDLKTPALLIKDVAAEHWRYGLWASATQVLGFIPGYMYYFLLNDVDAGALRALTTLYLPLIQANTALCLLLLPAFVRTEGTPEGKRLHRLSLLILTGVPTLYWIVLAIFNRQVMNLTFGGKYMEYAPLVWIVGFQPVIAGMCGVYASLLKAQQKLNAVFWGGVVAASGALIFGIWATKRFGMAGVCWSIVITYAMHHITLWLFSHDFLNAKRQRKVTSLPEDLVEMA